MNGARHRLVLACCTVSLACGCATKIKPVTPVFYPADASIARMQFLTSISAPQDIEKKQNAFLTFLIGGAVVKKGPAKPYGLAMSGGKLYIADTISRTVHIADLQARQWSYFTSRNMTALKKPINLDVDDMGTMYIADAEHGQVMMFASNLVYTGAIGAPGEMKPVDVKVRHGRIYVADIKSHSVRLYDAVTKAFLFSAPLEEDKDKKLFSPTNIAVDSAGNIYVSDTGSFRVQKYDAKGSYLKTFGSHGQQMGQFARNKGIAVDRQNRLFAVDAAFHVCQIFNEDGKLLLFFGEKGTASGSLFLPAGMIVEYDHNKYFEKYVDPRFELDYLVLIVSQFGSGGVNVYGMVRRKQ